MRYFLNTSSLLSGHKVKKTETKFPYEATMGSCFFYPFNDTTGLKILIPLLSFFPNRGKKRDTIRIFR
jgi:hypothetical protein